MNKIKISLLATAFILGVGAAFATTSLDQDPCPTDQNWINQNCNGVQTDCCITVAGQETLIDPNTGQPVGTAGYVIRKSF